MVSAILMSREQRTQGQPQLFQVGLARTRLRSLLTDSRPIVAQCVLQVHPPIITPLESNHMPEAAAAAVATVPAAAFAFASCCCFRWSEPHFFFLGTRRFRFFADCCGCCGCCGCCCDDAVATAALKIFLPSSLICRDSASGRPAPAISATSAASRCSCCSCCSRCSCSRCAACASCAACSAAITVSSSICARTRARTCACDGARRRSDRLYAAKRSAKDSSSVVCRTRTRPSRTTHISPLAPPSLLSPSPLPPPQHALRNRWL